MLRFLLLTVITVFLTSVGFSQTGTLRGVVKDSDDGNSIPFAKVIIESANIFAMTDIDGLYSIPEIPVGDYTVKITSSQFEDFVGDVTIVANKITELNVDMVKGKTLGAIDVLGSDQEKKIDPGTSINKMDNNDIKRVPATGGLPEFAIAIQTVPGIVTTGDQGGQFYVRGGTPIQNKILLDGMTIYNPFHSIGFFSVFETDLIKSADIYTGGFNAKYGGRISSVMDLSYRDGNLKRMGGMVGISPFTSSLLLEGPLSRDNVSFVIAGKASLLEQTSKTLYPYINDGEGLPFNFWDLYSKVTIAGSGANKFSVFGFSFNDQVTYQAVSNLNWNSWGGGTNFIFVPANSELFMKGRFNVSSYDILLQEENIQDRSSGITGAELAFDFTYHLPGKHKLDYGFGFNYFQTEFTTYNEVNRLIEHNDNTIEAGAYVSYRMVTDNRRLILEPSFRFQGYSSVGQVTAEPRISGKFNITENMRFKGAGGYYTQNFTSTTSDKDVVNLFYGFITAPENLPSRFILPDGSEKEIVNGLQKAWHAVAGLEFDLTKKLSLNIEGYYKWFSQMTNINRNKIFEDNAENFEIDDLYKKDFIVESGEAFGGDIVFNYKTKKLYLWLAYSIGKVVRWNGFDYYAPVFDRRHNVNFIGSYTFGKDDSWELTARWNLGTGLPFKQTTGVYEEPIITSIDGSYVNGNASELTFIYDDQNNGRLPTYHRLDISLKKELTSHKWKNLKWDIVAGVTNAYSRDNIFYVNRVTNERVHQLPIMPSMAVSMKF